MNEDRRVPTLRDLGERSIVKGLIAPRFQCQVPGVVGIGDDCAVIPAPGDTKSLVFTTDPCPTPVICLLETPDFYYYGWFTVLINVSDLAAMGATPVGLLVSTVMPESMPTKDYERFLDGLADASQRWNCPVLGGNIKDGSEFSATGSALGIVESDLAMLRTGAKAGDRVLVVGEMGLFWAACLTRLGCNVELTPSQSEDLRNALYFPYPKLKEGVALGKSRLVTACMDSSDGVSGCLRELAAINDVDIIVENKSLQPHPGVETVAKASGIDVRKLMLSWGDWQLVCTVSTADVPKVQDLMTSIGAVCADIGEVNAGAGHVFLRSGKDIHEISNFSNERFSGSSFFTHGLDAYVTILRSHPLTIGSL